MNGTQTLDAKKIIVVSIEEFCTAKDDDALWDRNS
jgi:hypothetical protein